MNISPQENRYSTHIKYKPHLVSFILTLFLAGISWYAINAPALNPPSVVPDTASESLFSAERARVHLYQITKKTRAVGSVGHKDTRQYIIDEFNKLGLENEVQKTTSLHRFPNSVGAAYVKNIIARIPGTNPTKAVVLMAHYDSAVHSFGATDAGNGVAAILETSRAILSGPPLENDVILLITDAEEPGLYGARAYVNDHPWASETGVVLNAEGRGYTGPVIMFRTSGENGRLIQILAKTAPRPFGDSMSNETFRHMPNDTDLSVFIESGYAGMDFANVHGLTHYHTQLDNYENAEPRSLQHHGDYMLSLTRELGHHDLTKITAPDRIYFTIPALGFIHYPESWALPLSILTLILILYLLVSEFRKGNLTLKKGGLGFLYCLGTLIILPLLAVGLWYIIEPYNPEVEWFVTNASYSGGFYLVAICLLIAAVYIAPASWLSDKLSTAGIMAGPFIVLSVIALATSILTPGASFLFLWPLLFSAVGFALARSENVNSIIQLLAVFIVPIPILFIMLQAIEGAEVMMTLNFIAIPIILLVLMLGLFGLQINLICRQLAWKLPLTIAAIGLGMIFWGIANSGFDESRKKPNGVNYIVDVNKNEAWWYSLDPEPDEWTSNYLGINPEQGKLPEWAPQYPFGFTNMPWINPAPVLRTDAPDMLVLSDSISGHERHIHLRITNPPGVYVTVTRVHNISVIELTAIDGKKTRNDIDNRFYGQLLINYFAPEQDGFEVSFKIPADEIPEIYLRSNIPGLPAFEDGTKPARYDFMMAAERWRDITQLQKTYILSGL
jgi:hypothetical protein